MTATTVTFARHIAVIHQCSVTGYGGAFDPAAVSVDASLETAMLSEYD